jgi:hypothetical protein
MTPAKGWLPLLTLLFLCGRHEYHFQPAPRKIAIIDGKNAAYTNTGDTLWLTGSRAGDTLTFSFSVKSGNGYGWDMLHYQSLKRLYQKTWDPINSPGENAVRFYLFGFTIIKPESFMLQFAYRRSETENPLRQCIILPRQ